ncbi:hypothetical protein C8J57DRAFT_573918 [Mycena rebaudengoi]|nr:hypothetical protein C8J57DRAFT_573918 [Mycena rebaudengoi]
MYIPPNDVYYGHGLAATANGTSASSHRSSMTIMPSVGSESYKDYEDLRGRSLSRSSSSFSSSTEDDAVLVYSPPTHSKSLQPSRSPSPVLFGIGHRAQAAKQRTSVVASATGYSPFYVSSISSVREAPRVIHPGPTQHTELSASVSQDAAPVLDNSFPAVSLRDISLPESFVAMPARRRSISPPRIVPRTPQTVVIQPPPQTIVIQHPPQPPTLTRMPGEPTMVPTPLSRSRSPSPIIIKPIQPRGRSPTRTPIQCSIPYYRGPIICPGRSRSPAQHRINPTRSLRTPPIVYAPDTPPPIVIRDHVYTGSPPVLSSGYGGPVYVHSRSPSPRSRSPQQPTIIQPPGSQGRPSGYGGPIYVHSRSPSRRSRSPRPQPPIIIQPLGSQGRPSGHGRPIHAHSRSFSRSRSRSPQQPIIIQSTGSKGRPRQAVDNYAFRAVSRSISRDRCPPTPPPIIYSRSRSRSSSRSSHSGRTPAILCAYPESASSADVNAAPVYRRPTVRRDISPSSTRYSAPVIVLRHRSRSRSPRITASSVPLRDARRRRDRSPSPDMARRSRSRSPRRVIVNGRSRSRSRSRSLCCRRSPSPMLRTHTPRHHHRPPPVVIEHRRVDSRSRVHYSSPVVSAAVRRHSRSPRRPARIHRERSRSSSSSSKSSMYIPQPPPPPPPPQSPGWYHPPQQAPPTSMGPYPAGMAPTPAWTPPPWSVPRRQPPPPAPLPPFWAAQPNPGPSWANTPATQLPPPPPAPFWGGQTNTPSWAHAAAAAHPPPPPPPPPRAPRLRSQVSPWASAAAAPPPVGEPWSTWGNSQPGRGVG